MGTWGSGNLESDGAFEAIGDRSIELTNRVWDALRSPTSAEADESEHDALFVDLEWLLTLEEAGLFNGWFLPPVNELDQAFEGWFEAWSDYFDGLADADFKAERRGIIEDTFNRLREVCATYEQRRS